MFSEEIPKEGLQVETSPLEDVEMLKLSEAVQHGLGVFDRGIRFSLVLDEEASKVVDAHDSILRVPLEDCLDICRWICRPQSELPSKAEADPVCRHSSLNRPFFFFWFASCSFCKKEEQGNGTVSDRTVALAKQSRQNPGEDIHVSIYINVKQYNYAELGRSRTCLNLEVKIQKTNVCCL